MRSALSLALLLIAACFAVSPASANPLAQGWTLDPAASNIRFQSIKNSTVVESSAFADFDGQIAPDGAARITVYLDSVDTKIDLRNVRMRFLFFETFLHPKAVISTRIDPALVETLAATRRQSLTLPFTLSLHGVEKEMSAEVVATVLSEDLVSVASAVPISIAIADFGFEENIRKLEEAANVAIVPSATVSFDFIFARTGGALAPQVAALPAEPASRAQEASGDFSREACEGRFEILSRTGNIYFRVGSAALDAASGPVLDSLADIARRCPGLRVKVAGHTDSDGGARTNQRLSLARAQSVTDYLVSLGLPATRFEVAGYGETQPVAPNDTAANKRRNRRIEFGVLAN